MAKTPSTMVPLGSIAPHFCLPSTDGVDVDYRSASAAPAKLVMFICNHCPFVKHVRYELAAIGRDYAPRGVAIFAINSNDADAYPADSFDMMKVEKAEAGYNFPYLYDASQSVARAYNAACTPDFFLYDANDKLVYRGQLDDSRPGHGIPVTGKNLRQALDLVLKGEVVPIEQKPSIGCNIKWKTTV